MLERILEQQKAIYTMSHEHFIGIARPLSREEWTIIGQLVAVLSPFRAIMESLSRENAILSQVISLFTHLSNKLDDFLSNRELLPGVKLVADISALLRSLKGQLTRRINKLIEACPEQMFVSMCDPRIKGKMSLWSNVLTIWRDKFIERVCDR